MAKRRHRQASRVSAGIGITLAVAVAICTPGTATAKTKAEKTVYPVRITAKLKPSELPPDSKWRNIPGVDEYPVVVAYGRVTSAKSACRRNRPIITYSQPSGAAAPEKDKRTGIATDGVGNWEGEPVPDFSLTESIRTGKERLWVEVPLKRIGKDRFCRAAKARLKVEASTSESVLLRVHSGTPDKLTLKAKREPIPLPPGSALPPTEGYAFLGKLTSQVPACRRGRQVFALYEFPPYSGDPLVREMWPGENGGKVTTDGRGNWRASPVSFAYLHGNFRVTAVVKAKRLSQGRTCPRVESRRLTLAA